MALPIAPTVFLAARRANAGSKSCGQQNWHVRAVALALSLYVRAASLALIAGESLGLAAAVLIGAAALSRTAALIPLAVLPPARENGAGFAAGKAGPSGARRAACLGVIFALAPVLAGTGPVRALTAIAVATGAAYAIVPLARKLIGGQTGDVAGAAQQLSEIAFYLAFAARVKESFARQQQ